MSSPDVQTHVQLQDVPYDICTVVASHLTVWERIGMSQTCRSMRSLTCHLPYGDFPQVKNKYYTNLQLLDQYNEWTELRRMTADGYIVAFAPHRFTLFVLAYNRMKKKLNNEGNVTFYSSLYPYPIYRA